MSRSARLAAMSVFATLLGACAAGGPVVQTADIYGGYTPQIMDYSASRGGMLAEVIGNPFAAPKEELDAVVVETMARAHFGQKFPFFTKAPEGYSSPYRVVVAMNPAPGTSAYALCAGTVQTQPRGPRDPDRAAAALCARESVITATSGTIFGPTGPRDPGFVHLISQISLTLFPPRDPNRDNDRGKRMIF